MHASEIIRWIIAVPLGLLGWWIIFVNFAIVYRWLVYREHNSWIPFLGGFLAFFGMLAVPIPRVENHAFIPLILDCGYMVASITFGLIGMAPSRPFRGKKSDRSDKTGSPIE